MTIRRCDLIADEMVKLFQGGMSCTQIAKKFHADRHTITRRIKGAGYKIDCSKSSYQPKGKNSPLWKGGKWKNRQGYVLVWQPREEHNRRTNYRHEHIIVWEKYHNKRVPKGYVIHHLNGIKDDNRPENLLALPKGEHDRLAEPYKKRIRELEIIIQRLSQPSLGLVPPMNNEIYSTQAEA